MVGVFIGVGLWLLAKLAVSREIEVSSRARAQLSTLNAELEQRVSSGRSPKSPSARGRQKDVNAWPPVVDSSDDAIISKTLEGTINAWNRGAEKVFGYSSSEAVGEPMLMLFPSDRVNEESDILARIRRGESVEHFETVRIRKDGRKLTFPRPSRQSRQQRRDYWRLKNCARHHRAQTSGRAASGTDRRTFPAGRGIVAIRSRPWKPRR